MCCLICALLCVRVYVFVCVVSSQRCLILLVKAAGRRLFLLRVSVPCVALSTSAGPRSGGGGAGGGRPVGASAYRLPFMLPVAKRRPSRAPALVPATGVKQLQSHCFCAYCLYLLPVAAVPAGPIGAACPCHFSEWCFCSYTCHLGQAAAVPLPLYLLQYLFPGAAVPTWPIGAVCSRYERLPCPCALSTCFTTGVFVSWPLSSLLYPIWRAAVPSPCWATYNYFLLCCTRFRTVSPAVDDSALVPTSGDKRLQRVSFSVHAAGGQTPAFSGTCPCACHWSQATAVPLLLCLLLVPTSGGRCARRAYWCGLPVPFQRVVLLLLYLPLGTSGCCPTAAVPAAVPVSGGRGAHLANWCGLLALRKAAVPLCLIDLLYDRCFRVMAAVFAVVPDLEGRCALAMLGNLQLLSSLLYPVSHSISSG